MPSHIIAGAGRHSLFEDQVSRPLPGAVGDAPNRAACRDAGVVAQRDYHSPMTEGSTEGGKILTWSLLDHLQRMILMAI